MRQWLKSTMAIPRGVAAGIALSATLITFAAFATPAAAGAGWSRNPDSSLAGGRIQVASSTSTLCQWLQPTEPPAAPPTSTTTGSPHETTEGTPAAASDPIAYDGVRVELRLEGGSGAIALGSVAVTTGGAWSGAVTIPAPTVAPAGTYDLLAHCVVDDPNLDGVRSFDFDPLSLAIVESPPPTTITVPTEIIPPITVTNPVQVQGEQVSRPPTIIAKTVANPAAAVPTLPKTGDGTLAVALAGVGALMLGAGALWYGGRQTLRHPEPR